MDAGRRSLCASRPKGPKRMNFQQLRIVRETVRNRFNLTEAANALFTSQSGVSKHIRDLEEELGVEMKAPAGTYRTWKRSRGARRKDAGRRGEPGASRGKFFAR